jgi:hypothetical protein
MTGMDRSELLAELVKAGCRRSVVSDRQAAAGEPVEPDAGQSRGDRRLWARYALVNVDKNPPPGVAPRARRERKGVTGGTL